MYRISRVLETSSIAIVKVAGQVNDSELDGWHYFLQELESESARWLVLDFCDVSRVDCKATEMLLRMLPSHVLLLNCPTGIKNMADTAGRRRQVLEPTSCPEQQPCFLNLYAPKGAAAGY